MLQLHVSLSLSLSRIAVSRFLSFRIVICRGFRAIHGNAQREQRYEQFANSLSETQTRQAVWAGKLASWSVSILCFFVPSFAFHRTSSLGKTCRLLFSIFFFHIKHLSHRAIYSSFLSTSGSCANHLRLSSLYPRALFLSRILQQIDTKLRDVSNCEYETRQRRSEKEEEILKESRERRTRQRYGNHEIVTHTAIVSPASALAPLSRAFSLSLLIFFVYPFPSLQMSSVLFLSSSNSVGAIQPAGRIHPYSSGPPSTPPRH